MTDDVAAAARAELARFLNSESLADVRRADDGTPTFTGALWNDLNRAPWPPTDDAAESTWWARLVSDVPIHSYAWWVRLLHLIAAEGTPAFDPADVNRAFSSEVKPLAFDEQSEEAEPRRND